MTNMESSNEKSGRRSFLSKYVSAAALAGVTAMILGQTAPKELLPRVRAADGDPLVIGQWNSGSSATGLNSSPAGGNAFEVITTDADGVALKGTANATSGGEGNCGVLGVSDHPNGVAVFGLASDSGPGIGDNGGSAGVGGTTVSQNGIGVYGHAKATAIGPDYGSVGVWAANDATSGSADGLLARTRSSDGAALRGRNRGNGGLDLVLDGQGLAGLVPRTSDPPIRSNLWQVYIINTKGNKFKLRILGPNGTVNDIFDLRP